MNQNRHREYKDWPHYVEEAVAYIIAGLDDNFQDNIRETLTLAEIWE